MQRGKGSAGELLALFKHVHWAVALFMSIVIAVARDSMNRDFALLGGLVIIVAITEFRDYLAQ